MKKNKENKEGREFPIVFIQWIDSYAATDGWTDLDEISLDDCIEIHTVGFLLKESEDRVIVGSNIGLDKSGIGYRIADMATTIPKAAIISLRKIKE